jgi:very-short-patch-repair endonuclease
MKKTVKDKPKRQTKAERYPWVLDKVAGIVGEYQFHPTRRWKFDFAIVDEKVAIEVDGGIWSGGRHSGGAGQIGDMEKGNEAVKLGWRVLHYTPQQIKGPKWLDDLQTVLWINNAR